MQARTIRIGTRGSPLALAQAHEVRGRLMTAESDAAGTLNLEQGRSSDLNRQLDELERQLARPPQ